MNVTVLDRQPETDTQSQLGFVDCDVHPYTKSPADLDPFLSERWREHRADGRRARRARRSSARRIIRACRPAWACASTPGRRTAAIPVPTST